ncbi:MULTISPECIES: hypothetical protein [unclassified Haladaptatus]|uniref:hypothetical protein n=1 Tax=unclassified Haladaptatus TaxID=2622732 RepID=UPI0023E8E513|nr:MULTISPECIES: hypothetical protein [unclassified Haladaptatus]
MSESLEETLEMHLMSFGVYVTDATVTQETLELEYETVAPGTGVPQQSVGQVVTVYREQAARPRRIEARVTDTEGTLRGTWHMEKGWLEALDAEDITEVGFSTYVLNTISE